MGKEQCTYKGFHDTFAALLSYQGVVVRVRAHLVATQGHATSGSISCLLYVAYFLNETGSGSGSISECSGHATSGSILGFKVQGLGFSAQVTQHPARSSSSSSTSSSSRG